MILTKAGNINLSLFWMLWIIFPIGLAGQGDVAFLVRADLTKVPTRERVEVSYIIENARLEDFSPPEFSPFRVTSGPYRSLSTQIINGKASSSTSYTYVLQAPAEPGTYTIKPASMKAKGLTYRSGSLTIEVVETKSEPNLLKGKGEIDGQVIVTASISKDTAFPGEQVIYSLDIFSKENVRVEILKSPEFDNFTEAGIGFLRNSPRRVTINGEVYLRRTIRKFAIFPQRSGTFEIEPVIVRADIPTGGRKQGIFFSVPRTRSETVYSNRLNMVVKPLPEEEPPTFFGAVGRHRIRTTIDKVSLTTDDAITAEVLVQGPGEQRRLSLPDFSQNEKFDVYDPQWIERDYDYSNESVLYRSKFRVELVPKEAGEYYWSPRYTYFDVDSMAYITISPDTFFLQIRKGEGFSASELVESISVREKLNMEPLKSPGSFVSKSRFFGTPVFWLLYLLTPGFFAARTALSAYRSYKDSKKEPMPPEQALILQLRNVEKEDGHDNWLQTAENGLEEVISVRFNMERAEMTKRSVEDRMRESKLPEDLINRYLLIHDRLEMLSYTGVRHSSLPEEGFRKEVVDWLASLRSIYNV
jgi:hypothetical protein